MEKLIATEQGENALRFDPKKSVARAWARTHSGVRFNLWVVPGKEGEGHLCWVRRDGVKYVGDERSFIAYGGGELETLIAALNHLRTYEPWGLDLRNR